MTSLRLKATIGMALTTCFAITLISGIVLHLKKHGIVAEPREIIKIIHWVSGLAMCVLAVVHGKQFGKVLIAMSKKYKWFYYATIILVVLLGLTFLTGAVKLLSPVKIPHLGLWHYFLGLAMSVATIFHLIRGIPSLRRMVK